MRAVPQGGFAAWSAVELGLGGERQAAQVAREAQLAGAHARGLELARVEGVLPEKLADEPAEPLALERGERLALERLFRRQRRRDAHVRPSSSAAAAATASRDRISGGIEAARIGWFGWRVAQAIVSRPVAIRVSPRESVQT